MACERYLDALSDVAAGEAPSPEFEKHLEACDACRAELAALRQALARVDGELTGLLSAEPSASLLPRVRAAVEADRSPHPARWLGSPVWLAVAATVLVAAVLSVFVGEQPSTPTTSRAVESSTGARSAAARPAGESQGRPVDSSSPVSSSIAGPGASGGESAERVARGGRAAAPLRPPKARPVVTMPAEVLVPAEEAEALVRLAGVLVEGRVGVGELMTASTGPSRPLAEPALIEIRPLEIVPTEPSGSSGT